jgi:hypothetical protein
MGWKAAIRSQEAAQRRAKREEASRAKERERASAARRKELLAQSNANEVEVYENYLEVVKSLHTDCSDTWEWNEVATRPDPSAPALTREAETAARIAHDSFRSSLVAPVRSNVHEHAARVAEAAYSPGMMERLLGQDSVRRGQLRDAVHQAIARDQAEFNSQTTQYQAALAVENSHRARLLKNIESARTRDAAVNQAAAEKHAARVAERAWFRNLARAVLQYDPAAFACALQYLVNFDELQELGAKPWVRDVRSDGVAIDCEVADADSDIVPHEELSLGAGGSKINRKKLAESKRQDIYQDYACSAALRIAREVFALLPIDRVVVNVGAATIDTSTGHPRLTTHLAVHFPRERLSQLNFAAIDASDSMRNFDHRMKFKKSTGFAPVDDITLDEQWAGST